MTKLTKRQRKANAYAALAAKVMQAIQREHQQIGEAHLRCERAMAEARNEYDSYLATIDDA